MGEGEILSAVAKRGYPATCPFAISVDMLPFPHSTIEKRSHDLRFIGQIVRGLSDVIGYVYHYYREAL